MREAPLNSKPALSAEKGGSILAPGALTQWGGTRTVISSAARRGGSGNPSTPESPRRFAPRGDVAVAKTQDVRRTFLILPARLASQAILEPGISCRLFCTSEFRAGAGNSAALLRCRRRHKVPRWLRLPLWEPTFAQAEAAPPSLDAPVD
jgi:hypothetical protein